MYNIGLDIGTGSVGWCLTDENGYLLKVNRKGKIVIIFAINTAIFLKGRLAA